MSRPLIISDCDEVLLHMVVPFKEWLAESQGITFNLDGANFGEALRWNDSGKLLEANEVWRMLGGFFDTEMGRQMPISGAVESINALSEHADIVILTNLVDKRRDMRTDQLAEHGIIAPVYTNQGPKGPMLEKILAEHSPSRAFFIDDLPQHHLSASETVPEVVRLHMCGEPSIAHAIDCAHKAGHADARIDAWSEALPWLMGKLEEIPA
ncbi:HAD family hydrolase [Erythrobacter crassostreae]|uniref:HAD family hydrolase n=1 Tax=Erythrobacter crassostreae TaxID=2828328 RepID=A0A9X1F144_9SPHN|nr:HAD family hydrolase [Erythrobacter crassostrea]MBV7258387.1 HAD family hydrolase [Erythrobacter crassostrea]